MTAVAINAKHIQTIGIISFFSSLRDFLEKKSIGRTTSVTINTSTELVRKKIILPSQSEKEIILPGESEKEIILEIILE